MNYTDPNYYRLEPYHNPEKVDESKVPRGWRMRYKSEAGKDAKGRCSIYMPFDKTFSICDALWGCMISSTYIVPVSEA